MKLIVAVAAMILLGGMANAGSGNKVVGRKVAAVKSSTITDTVVKMRGDEDGVIVLFEKHKGSFNLSRNAKDFMLANKKLEDSLNNKKPISVEIDGQELNILEVK